MYLCNLKVLKVSKLQFTSLLEITIVYISIIMHVRCHIYYNERGYYERGAMLDLSIHTTACFELK